MKESKFEKIENKQEKVLNPEEIEELEEDMGQYVKGLSVRIEEIKKELKIRVDDEKTKELKTELVDLEEQYEGLKDFVDAIKEGDHEEITEGLSNTIESMGDNKREQRRERIIALAKELSENQEGFLFSGIDSTFYEKTKAEEEEFPSLATPIDELVERFKSEGIKVVLGKNPKSGNVFILPLGSNDVENDSIFPKYLEITEGIDEKLKELVLADKG